MSTLPKKRDDISIVLCGAAGQGVQTVEQLLTHLLKYSGYHLFSTKEYMSRVRGGTNSTELRVSSKPVRAYVDRIDFLVPLSRAAIDHLAHRIGDETIILGERGLLYPGGENPPSSFIHIPFSEIAEKIGGKLYANIIATGVILSLMSVGRDDANTYIGKRFASKGDTVVGQNTAALDRGYEIGNKLLEAGTVSVSISSNDSLTDEIIVNGGEAVAMGAIAGGCNFISSYPMTPSTSVLTFLAQHGQEFDIIAEQAEDEIAAINMTIGAWYAGARGMVTTSGGGFALMEEGMSLAGCIESPVVIHLAQRPGPATGLPTRTEQGDLELVLYSGHGEFPRAIFAPGTLEQAFELTAWAFNCADEFQVPVFVLTDQYFIDSYYNIAPFDLSMTPVESHVVKTEEGYSRYKLTPDGISPRGIPGFGEGLVAVDSDEHTEDGHLTESHNVRVAMMDKRMGKLAGLVSRALSPEIIGNDNAETMVVCWGSTHHVVTEACARIGRDDVAVAHFAQVYPLAASTGGILRQAKRIIAVENNATGQFARILKLHADIDVDEKILKYNGIMFSVEELTDRLGAVL